MRVKKERNVLAPKPVHPTAVRMHGLFGTPFVRQHMMVDQRWSPDSLIEQYKGMADLLGKRNVFKQLESIDNRRRYLRESRILRQQVNDGHAKLQMAIFGNNTKRIRNCLIKHKDMQRLYQHMPIHKVLENIDQRTFVLRKERDRLSARLGVLKKRYECELLEKATLEDRIKYEKEYTLTEEIKSRKMLKKIENSKVRMRAIQTVNNVYKKMLTVVTHDGIFYETICRSLADDIENQRKFIEHILYLGLPAIQTFKRLNEEYRKADEKSRKSMLTKQQWMAGNEPEQKKHIEENRGSKVFEPAAAAARPLQRYVRETKSMLVLKKQLETIENTIKEVKNKTLCSQAKEIYPRMKSQVENNEKLNKRIEKNMMGHEQLQNKMNRAQVYQSVLIHNLSEEENARMEHIAELTHAIEKERQIELKTLEHMKTRADVKVLLRCTLWNVDEILKHVDRGPRTTRIDYPNSYLKLPLLKFDMLMMRAVPPEPYTENVENVMNVVRRKVAKLMKAYKDEPDRVTMETYKEAYHNAFIESMETGDVPEDGDVQRRRSSKQEEENDLMADVKTGLSVPSRKQIKAQSAKIVETLSKKEDE